MNKNRNIICVIMAIMLTAILCTTLVACKPSLVTITYVASGQDDIVVDVDKDNFILPTDPVKEGSIFEGWYLDEGVWKDEFLAGYFTIIEEFENNTTVYAYFVDISMISEPNYTATYEYTGEEQTVEIRENVLYEITGDIKGTELGEYTATVALRDKDYYNWEDGTTENVTIVWEIVDMLEYTETEDSVAVVGYSGKLEDVVIPKLHNGKPVTSISDLAFNFCDSLTNINIPDSVTSIGYLAFRGCRNLISIEIPAGVTSIGVNAFNDCDKLVIRAEVTEANAPSDWDALWNGNNRPVIYDCDNNDMADDGYMYYRQEGIIYQLKDGNASLYSASSYIENVVIADSVIYKNSAYYVTSIGVNAFRGCRDLISLEMPAGVTIIGDYAFNHCSSLRSVTIPDSVTSIGVNAFNGCSSLTSVTIPDSVTSIGYYAFNVYKLVIRAEVTEANAPSDWDALWNGNNRPVIYDCDNNDMADDGYMYLIQEGIIYQLKERTASLYSASSYIENINILDIIEYNGIDYKLTSIGDYAFNHCSSLRSVAIPDSVTSIGVNAFNGCSSLTIFTYMTKEEVQAVNWSDDWNGRCPVHYAGTWYIDTDGVPTIGVDPSK